MAHFANIINGKVDQVIVLKDKHLDSLDFPHSEKAGQKLLQNLGLEGLWLQTSYNSRFRNAFAGKDYTYDNILDAFIPPKPFESWIFDSSTMKYHAPVSKPTKGGPYKWNESQKKWSEE